MPADDCGYDIAKLRDNKLTLYPNAFQFAYGFRR